MNGVRFPTVKCSPTCGLSAGSTFPVTLLPQLLLLFFLRRAYCVLMHACKIRRDRIAGELLVVGK